MDPGLLDLLRKNNEPNTPEFTHVTTYGPKSKWCIPDTNWESFWRDYCGLVYENNSNTICLAEIPKKHVPVIADFTLKFHPLEGYNDTYGYDFVLSVVYCYQQAMMEIFKISASEVELMCCVLESEDYMEDNLLISHFKLQFPYCKTLPSVQTRLLRPLVIKTLRSENVIGRLSQSPINTWEKIIDPLTTNKPSMMYGSSKSSTIPVLKLEYIFHKILPADINTMQTEVMEIENAFMLPNHEHVQSGTVSSSMFSGESIEFWLPMFLSSSY